MLIVTRLYFLKIDGEGTVVAAEVAVIGPLGYSPAGGGGYVYLYLILIVGGLGAAGYYGGTLRVTLYADVVGGVGFKDGLYEARGGTLHVEATDEGGFIRVIIPTDEVETGIWGDGDLDGVAQVVGSGAGGLAVGGIDGEVLGFCTVTELGYEVIVTEGYEGAGVLGIAVRPADELIVLVSGGRR